jgi:hypothetical protein
VRDIDEPFWGRGLGVKAHYLVPFWFSPLSILLLTDKLGINSNPGLWGIREKRIDLSNKL